MNKRHTFHHHSNHEHFRHGRLPFSPLVRTIISAIALKMLKKQEMHGYQLAEEISKFVGRKMPKPMIYSLLKRLEHENFVVSRWDMPESGPAKRIYRITDLGVQALERKLKSVMQLKELLEKILEE